MRFDCLPLILSGLWVCGADTLPIPEASFPAAEICSEMSAAD